MPLEGAPLDDESAAVRTLELAHFGDSYRIYAGLADGRVFRWDGEWSEPPELIESAQATGGAVTALSTLLGEETLVTATESGPVQTWFGVRASAEARGWNLTNIREFGRLPSTIRLILPTPRSKSFVLFDEAGHGRVDHHTTARTLATLPDLGARPVAACVSPKNDAIVVVDETGRLHRLDYSAPHPETSLATLFTPVWYESGEQPDLKWQSTGGSDDFEPKMSLTVLVFGSLKGVLYALVFSVPIGVLAAIYTALFLPGRLRNIIKPSIEILAAIPSVVVGLLAALWLSPIVERHLTTVFALAPAFLLTSAMFLAGWTFVPRRRAARILASPWLLLISFGSFVIPFVLALAIGPWLDHTAFAGDVQGFMRNVLGVSYTNRNAVVVGFALGFAVIPVIFTISEDAIMNVPRSLWAASEALGATRWQTTWRVVVPAAAPGIFAALMLGFGRAVGETMIVLLAAGNTPLVDLSPFSGMRTISACIAVEIPEAPNGGTLYRVLFLSGVLLFLFTFVCNTVAEVVGHRLRRKYGRF
jgi:phosphate transport system permease protein